jgi:3-oxoacyl-[acyl-carrier protein] reductase
MMPEKTMKQRVALIAGGSSGIGAAVAQRLAAEGIPVHIGFRTDQQSAETVAGEIRQNGGRASITRLDLCSEQEVDSVCTQIYESEGSLDIVVNAAAITTEEPLPAMSTDSWKKVVETNLDGCFLLCRAASKFMMLNRWGRIINLSSIAAHHGGRGQASYSVSKAGVESLSRVLALELGRKGILVNCVAPGVIETEMTERIRREHGEDLRRVIACRRFGTPNEVASVAVFLCSEAASYVNGQVIRVDGGMLL